MPDGQYSQTSNARKIGVDLDILGKEVHGGPGLSENAQNTLEELLELNNLMAKSLILDEPDLSKKIGVVRANRTTTGIQTWNRFAAMYTIGSNKGGSCDITFETRDLLGRILERMRINGAGNVGIGTTTPTDILHVEGNGAYIKTRVFPSDDNTPGLTGFSLEAREKGGTDHTWRIYTAAVGGGWGVPGNSLTFWEYGFNPSKTCLPRMVLQANTGNVGIGTTTPEAGLHIDKANTNDVALKLSSNGPGWGSGIQLKNNDIAYGIYSGFERFHICDVNKQVDRLIIDAAGNVGIGTGSPSAKLEVNGDIKVTGDVILTNADCAEDFDITCTESVEPGTVMVINDGGTLKPSQQAYDRRVAGVISGAGDLRPGITLDRQKERANRLPLALTGKAYCKVDAEYNPVNVGDLLTTSSTIGHAMKADDRDMSFGAVIGKALRPLKVGQGLIPILIALQ